MNEIYIYEHFFFYRDDPILIEKICEEDLILTAKIQQNKTRKYLEEQILLYCTVNHEIFTQF